MLLQDYELCERCRKVFVKEVFKTYKNKPLCTLCRAALREGKK